MGDKEKAYIKIGDTFGAQLLEFAQSVDIFNRNNFKDLKDEIVDYLKKNFEIMVLGHLVPDLVPWGSKGLVPGLDVTDWMSGGKDWGKPIKNDDGSYYGQVSYAYGEKQNLWIVSGDDSNDVIKEGGKFKNVKDLSVSSKLPDFEPSNISLDIRTSIIYPLTSKKFRQPHGVINFESTERLRLLNILDKELKNIAYAIGILYQEQKGHEYVRDRTRDRLKKLKELSFKSFWGKKRRIFFAYSHKCNKDIVETVKEIFDEKIYIQNGISLIIWEDFHKPNIMEEIWNEIDDCQAGICYFSEINYSESENKTAKFEYVDNQNVLFEAGMMHALQKTREEVFKEWLLLREKNSPPRPFNIANRRLVEIDRDNKNQVKKNDIKKIKENVKWLIEHTFIKEDKKNI